MTRNKDGITGWGRIQRSTNAAVVAGQVLRIHVCFNNPCNRRHHGSKCWPYGKCVHMREVQDPFAPEVALPEMEAAPEAAPTAVAEPIAPSETTSTTELAAPSETTSPPEVPAPEMQPAAELVPASAVGPAIPMSPIEAPSTPKTAALKRLKPPAPASLPDLTDGSDVNTAAVAGVPPEVQAKHQIDAALLRLAREIRQPRAYVGYSAFVLMGLLKRCQPWAWEGSVCFNLLQRFAPWAIQHCTRVTLVSAIGCALVGRAGGSVECAPISEEHPLHKMSHFVAGSTIPVCEAAVAEKAPRFAAFYAALGVATMPTICDGD